MLKRYRKALVSISSAKLRKAAKQIQNKNNKKPIKKN